MCPWNREDTTEAETWMWRAIAEPLAARALAEEDDTQGNGERNPVKRWWFDLEVVDGIAVNPSAGVNERDLDLGRMRLAEKQRLAMFPVDLQPPGGTTMAQTIPVDREAGLRMYEQAERPQSARSRLAAIPIVAIQGGAP